MQFYDTPEVFKNSTLFLFFGFLNSIFREKIGLMEKLKSSLRNWMNSFRKTPLHPQWFVFKDSDKIFKRIADECQGFTLDIGAGRQVIRPFLSESVVYFPTDYYRTSVNWYCCPPELFADAAQLPLQAECADTVLLLDVMEHLPEPERCLEEVWRVLKSEGKVIIHVPFLYPLHDEPLDFQRWTEHGLRRLAEKRGFTIVELAAHGHPVETGAMIFNIAICKTGLKLLSRRNPLFLFMFLFPILIPAINLFAFFLKVLSYKDDFSPLGYRLILRKEEKRESSVGNVS